MHDKKWSQNVIIVSGYSHNFIKSHNSGRVSFPFNSVVSKSWSNDYFVQYENVFYCNLVYLLINSFLIAAATVALLLSIPFLTLCHVPAHQLSCNLCSTFIFYRTLQQCLSTPILPDSKIIFFKWNSAGICKE